MEAHRVAIYEVCSRNVIGTAQQLGTKTEVLLFAIDRCPKLTQEEKVTLTNRVKYGFESKRILLQQWCYTIDTSAARSF